jgi:uncharacterized protein YecE (DUF72 family)
VTARHVYVRGHGPGGRYRGNYSRKALERWADRIHDWTGKRRDVLIYFDFDNDQKERCPPGCGAACTDPAGLMAHWICF